MRYQLLFALFCSWLLATAARAAEPVPVLVSIMPQKWLVEQIGGELINVRVLLDKGQDPHGLQPTPEQVTTLFRSRIYFAIGLEFEQELLRKIRQSETKVRVVDISAGIAKIAMSEHQHDHYDQEEAHSAGLDPHIWLDPQNLQQMARAITAALKEADPSHAALYERNRQTVASTLTAVHAEIKALLAPFSGQVFLVYHPAFGYFAKAYSLRQKAVELEGKSPTPKQLYALIGQAKQDKVKIIFVQPQFDRKNAETIAQAIGGKVAALDSMAEDVPENLRRMAKQINSALSQQ
ncbi:metal ABC transporter solute-binding protein, Zn/Mn family [Candidatus Electronema sp. PJ]|uniref:metal ABC transporter solute-binding protein, Zn/Mn family n=1 Tax=Candidatus Electronema sp. PJ TaxID=3401572 RepID=UPI003AA99047